MVNFKIGDKVRIVRTYYTDGRQEPYYHGGELTTTPLKAEGIVEATHEYNKVRIKLNNTKYGTWGHNWTLHPSELQLIGNDQLIKAKETIKW